MTTTLQRRQIVARPVWILTAIVGVTMLVTSAGFYYTSDELYFLSAGKHLSWGYADQPPLVPFLAHLADSLFPDSLVALRLPSTIAVTAGVFVTAVIAREFGGRGRAQLLAAACYAISPLLLSDGHHLDTTSIDWCLWTVATWLVVRWVRTRDDRLWLALGVVTGFDLQDKYLILFFWAAIAAGVLIAGPRAMFARPLVWVAALIAVAMAVPSLLWQAHNGWPQLAMGSVLSDEAGDLGGRYTFLPYVFIYAGIAGGVLFCYGLWRLLRAEELRPYRFLGWASVVLIVGLLVVQQQPYYVAGLYAAGWAAAATRAEQGPLPRGLNWSRTWPALVISALVVVRGILPFPPDPLFVDSYVVNNVNDDFPKVVDTVAAAYREMAPSERSHTVVMANASGYAGALDQFGPRVGLPPVYSVERGSWYFGAPPDSATSVLYVGDPPDAVRAEFAQVRQVATYTDQLALAMHPRKAEVPVYLCSGLRDPWSRIWPDLRRLDQI